MKTLLAGLFITTAAWAGTNEVQLSGKLGCGHCGYHKTPHCTAAFKTDDGKIYVIDNASKDVMSARVKGGNVKVTGVVSEKDGVQHVQATQQELAK